MTYGCVYFCFLLVFHVTGDINMFRYFGNVSNSREFLNVQRIERPISEMVSTIDFSKAV